MEIASGSTVGTVCLHVSQDGWLAAIVGFSEDAPAALTAPDIITGKSLEELYCRVLGGMLDEKRLAKPNFTFDDLVSYVRTEAASKAAQITYGDLSGDGGVDWEDCYVGIPITKHDLDTLQSGLRNGTISLCFHISGGIGWTTEEASTSDPMRRLPVTMRRSTLTAT